MKLELKHIAPYLPYGLKYQSMGQHEKQEYIDIEPNPSVFEMTGLNGLWVYSNCDYDSFIEDAFPILRPLSDLTKEVLSDLREVENNDTLLWGVSGFNGNLTNTLKYETCLTYPVLEWLYKNHFDVFGLIEEGLAININTLNK